MAFQIRPIKNYRPDKRKKLFKTSPISQGQRLTVLPKRRKSFFHHDKTQLIKFIGYVAVGCAVLVFGYLAYALYDLPSMDQLQTGAFDQSTKVFDRNGGLLYEIHGANTGRRTIVSLSEISPNFTNALLAAEDDEFYKHGGFDWKGLIQGAVLNPLTGKRLRGGSTLTQQLIKNSLLTPERSVKRKIRELVLAIMAESKFTKDEILEMYCNQAAFGSNAYGVSAAAKTFFGKKAVELSPVEAATLVAILRAPTYYSPYGSNLDGLLWRRNWILSRMVELGMLSKGQDIALGKQELKVQAYREDIKAPHFVMLVKEMLVKKFGEDMVERGGLTVYTTLDGKMQKIADEAMAARREHNLKNYDASNASLVSVRPQTGEVLAMVGSYDYFDKTIDGAVNVSVRSRQPGSSIKPFAYAEAFLKGYSPATVVYDVKTNFAVGAAKYEPKNYDGLFRGPVSLRNALAQSLNIPAVKVLFLAGIPDTITFASKMGLTTLVNADRYGLSLVLGGGEVRLLDMVEAYATFASSGIHRELQFINLVQDNQGSVLMESKENLKGDRVLSDGVSYLVTSILSDNVARTPAFGASSFLQLKDRPAAVKTGTTNEARDGWVLGYTPSLVTGVWTGNNDNHPMKNGASAYLAAAPIWNVFMNKSLAEAPVEKFVVPADVRFVEVSSLSGKLPSRFTPEDKIIKEVFLKDNIPVEADDFYRAVAVNAVDGLLANQFCPSGSIEYLVYENFHSILPDKPNWESAVQAWASGFRKNRLAKITAGEPVDLPNFGAGSKIRFIASLGDVPTESSPLCTEDVFNMAAPLLRVISPSDYARVSPSEVEVVVAVTKTLRPLSKVEFYLNNQLQDTVASAQKSDGAAMIYEGKISLPADIESVYALKVIAYDDLLHSAEVALSIEAQVDKTPPKIEIIAPPPGSTIYWGTRAMVRFSARDDESRVARVEIYLDELDDSHRLGIVESAPYEMPLFILPEYGEGEHKLIARAFDTSGNFTKAESKIIISNPTSIETSIVPGAKIGAIISPAGKVKSNTRVPIVAKFRSLRYVSKLSFYMQAEGNTPKLLEQIVPENNEKYIQANWSPISTGSWDLWFVATFTNGNEVNSERVRVVVE
ncbi:MAG: penicillin-binding protein [Patescibacteria group bacterium]|nr:penicillin-binding protein [Patescibacteria group bacterium]